MADSDQRNYDFIGQTYQLYFIELLLKWEVVVWVKLTRSQVHNASMSNAGIHGTRHHQTALSGPHTHAPMWCERSLTINTISSYDLCRSSF